YGLSDIPLLINLNFMAGCAKRTLGWPAGGSLRFAQNIADRFTALGGRLAYKKRVSKIATANGRVTGVRLQNGDYHDADIVISAADGHSTIFDMLNGEYSSERLIQYYTQAPKHCDMTVQVALGVNRDMSQEPHALTVLLDEPVHIGGFPADRLSVEVFNFDDTLAPTGRYVIKVPLSSRPAYWQALSLDRQSYEEEKEKTAQTVIGCLEKRFPGLREQIEMIDVSTPLTVERYTGNWQGYTAPWLPPGGFAAATKGLSRTLPNLEGFYMAGQWGEGMIGISTVAVAGRKIIEMICKKDGRRFHTTSASQ
ncbi:MAG: FAD-dependent oxidoreductase, partial [Bacillota bacterium]|nr:FAD-dependent oxidoreductase [Bacillota bacterium]